MTATTARRAGALLLATALLAATVPVAAAPERGPEDGLTFLQLVSEWLTARLLGLDPAPRSTEERWFEDTLQRSRPIPPTDRDDRNPEEEPTATPQRGAELDPSG